jgi:abortive infection bacteriophage resistance protein
MVKPPITIKQQIELLKSRGMRFRDISKAPHFLENISYYRLKGYWWEMQTDKVGHFFSSDSYFEDAVQAYNFDRRFRLIIFNGIERIEIALRTKLIYHMSLNHGVHWYLDHHYFNRTDAHLIFLSKMFRDICNSSEEFIIKHKNNHKNDYPESWKALEIVTLGTLSKLYKNIYHQLPEKATIANEFGLNNQSYLASWLLSITLVRNIIAHHSRLWNRTVINKYDWPKSTPYP